MVKDTDKSMDTMHEDSLQKEDSLNELMKDNYVQYASYVILDRAIPSVVDGLKPVQRRILQTLFRLNDGKLHKVANVTGQTMQLHPHGDAPIYDALVNLANKGFLLDRQGNFGNLYTGDPASAARYIETRLSPLALETLFNPALTTFIASYDGRNEEPVALPSKIPLLLMQGAEGIAVGMATKVLPHNFVELLESQIAILNDAPFTLLPDFPTGGIMDPSLYDQGRGKVKVRAKVIIQDSKTLIIKEICPGTTTESTIRSIDEAAKKGKLKIESISDFTAEKVEIEIKLPRGQQAQLFLEPLFAYTDCEVSVSAQCIVIQDNLPWETDVHTILKLNTEHLKAYLKKELELEKARLEKLIFRRTLERIFIENRLYKNIETIRELQEIHAVIARALEPHHEELIQVPDQEDRDFLLALPIRRISRFDSEKNHQEIAQCEKALSQVLKDLKSIKRVATRYLNQLIKTYGDHFPRKTEVQTLEQVDLKGLETREVKVYIDVKKGFVGTAVDGDNHLECTNFDKILLLFLDGSYKVINIPEKQYVCHGEKKIAYIGLADKQTVLSLIYKKPQTQQCYGKRFVVEKFIVDKEYRFLDEGVKLELLTTDPDPSVELTFSPKPRQKASSSRCQLKEIPLKKVSAKGIRLSTKEIKKVKMVKKKAVTE